MKRLRRKRAAMIVTAFDIIRRRRMLLAEWVPGDINDANLVQQVTDIMATGGQMQIEYSGEWKTIEPYGWNSSKDGNVLLMCYKDTGEVRSYRLDRMTNVQFDPNTIDLSQYGLDAGDEATQESVEEIDGVEVPTLDDGSEFDTDQVEQESPFDGAIDALEEVDDEFMIEDLRRFPDEPETIDDDQFNPIDNEQLQPEEQQQTI